MSAAASYQDGKSGYQRLVVVQRPQVESATEEDFEATSAPHIQGRKRCRLLGLMLKAIVACLAVWGFLQLGHQFYARLHSSRKISCNCGASVAEAKSMNCKFDAIAAAWLPPHCIDSELSEQFDHAGDGPNGTWLYYSDIDKTRTLRTEELGDLADDPNGAFFTTHKWHVAHCYYNWLKEFRKGKTGVKMEARFDTEGHIRHCAMISMMETKMNIIATGSDVVLDADVIRKPKVPHQ